MRQFFLLTTLILSSTLSFSQPRRASGWNIDKSAGSSKTISFSTDEGTWMNLDVSPDGKEIVFDLLGDIYKMPVAGGKAVLLSGGASLDVQPRYSPNGKLISYTSDRNGVSNIWVMNTDGSGKRPVSREDDRLVNNAVWTNDNNYLVATRQPIGQSAGTSELWVYHIGGGDGFPLSKNNPKRAADPDVAPNSRFVYYSEQMVGNNLARNPNGEIFQVKRLDRQTGKSEPVAGGQGGACRPQISPDGRTLAFVRRVRLKSVLVLQDLDTGEEWPVYDELSRDQQETASVFSIYPNFGWTPDSRNIIFYANGKIRKLDVASQISSVIPFEVQSRHTITESLHFEHPVFQDEFDVRMIRQCTTAPDGKSIAFNAAGYIYVKDLASGKVERAGKGTDFEFDPEYSPEGKSLIFVSWNDEDKAAINRLDLKNGRVTKLINERGFYYSPKFSNKGDKIVFSKGVGNQILGYTYGKRPGIYVMAANGGNVAKVTDNGARPSFSADDSRIFFETIERDRKAFKSVNLDGSDLRTLYTSSTSNAFIPSPDGKWLAFDESLNLYITPLTSTGGTLELSSANKSLPHYLISSKAGSSFHWSKDSKKLMWTLGSQYFARDMNSVFDYADGGGPDSQAVDSAGTEIGLVLKADMPAGKLALTGARIITMKGDEIIENGTIVIEKNRIVAVGPGTEVKIPSDARVIDAGGQSIIPGLIDVHGRIPFSPDGITPKQDWGYFSNLAYGVTTSRDPSANSEMLLSQSEMIKAGRIIGPRMLTSATLLQEPSSSAGDEAASGDPASVAATLNSLGALSLSTSLQRRDRQQQLIASARNLKMEVFADGGADYYRQLSMILDGNSGIEHNMPVVPIFKDVKTLWNESKVGYTPTLISSTGAQPGENFWFDRTNVWENEKLLNFTPRTLVDARSRRRSTSEFGDYGHIEVAKSVKQLADGGTRINIGSNGRLQGLGVHWELWMLAQGGMSPFQALRCGTINGAEYLGISKELGSLEPGKLADLIVLDANPLDDIRNTEKIKYVMINGRLYDAETMNETGNVERSSGKFWWQQGRGDSFTLPTDAADTFLYTRQDNE